MKALYFFAVLALLAGCNCNKTQKDKNKDKTVLTDGHNSQNSLDYEGTYKGTEGETETMIVLNKDTFTMTTTIGGESKDVKGSFSWDETGSIITLNNTDELRYKVGENILILLDEYGNASTNKLKKQ